MWSADSSCGRTRRTRGSAPSARWSRSSGRRATAGQRSSSRTCGTSSSATTRSRCSARTPSTRSASPRACRPSSTSRSCTARSSERWKRPPRPRALLLPRQLLTDRPQFLDVRSAQAEVGDPDRVAHAHDVVLDLLERADPAVRVVAHGVRLDLPLLCELRDRLVAVVGERAVEEHRELDLAEARARRLTHRADLLAHRLDPELLRRDLPRSGDAGWHDRDDVRLAPCERQDVGPPARDEDRRMRLLHGLRPALGLLDVVVLAGERDLLLGEEALHQRHRLSEPRDAHAAAVERDAGALVVAVEPARADPELEAPVREHVDSRALAREHRRVAEVVVDDERAYT